MEFYNTAVGSRSKNYAVNQKTGFFGQKLVGIMNQFLGENMVNLYKIIDDIQNGYLDQYLREQNRGSAMVTEGEFNDVLEFREANQKNLKDLNIDADQIKKIRRKRGIIDFSEGVEYDIYVRK